MLRRFSFPVVLLLLAYALWTSADFMEIAAGVALFMFGMICLQEGFKAFTGGALEMLLRRSTDRRWKSLTFGMVTTTLMQSSTLVSLITISFVSAEMISLASGIGIIIGANLGTTTGAWLIAGLGLRVNIAAYAMPLLVFGLVFLMRKSKGMKGAGYLMIGTGLLFLGIHYMKDGFDAFQNQFDLSAYAVEGYVGVLLFVLLGTLVTMIMQSSHATLLVIIAALAAGQVTYENALALAIGANLGSAITTALGGLAANLGGKRLAAAHLVFNLTTALIGILFIHQLVWLVNHAAVLIGIAADDYLLKLALFHTLFNLIGVVLLTPLVSQLEDLLVRIIRPGKKTASEQPLYLVPQVLETPATVVSAVRKEVQHLFDNAYGLFAHGLSLTRATIDSDVSLSDAVRQTRRIIPIDVENVYEEKIKSLYSEIVRFISEAQLSESTEQATEELYALRHAGRNIVEAVKGMKHLHKNLSRYGLSGNPAVRERYDLIRLQLARLLRDLRQILQAEDEHVISLSLDAVRLSLQKSSRKLMDELDEMIRLRRIAPTIAISIMNDETYVNGLGNNLIDAVQTLVSPYVHKQTAQLSLEPQELQELVEQDAGASPQAAEAGQVKT